MKFTNSIEDWGIRCGFVTEAASPLHRGELRIVSDCYHPVLTGEQRWLFRLFSPWYNTQDIAHYSFAITNYYADMYQLQLHIAEHGSFEKAVENAMELLEDDEEFDTLAERWCEYGLTSTSPDEEYAGRAWWHTMRRILSQKRYLPTQNVPTVDYERPLGWREDPILAKTFNMYANHNKSVITAHPGWQPPQVSGRGGYVQKWKGFHEYSEVTMEHVKSMESYSGDVPGVLWEAVGAYVLFATKALAQAYSQDRYKVLPVRLGKGDNAVVLINGRMQATKYHPELGYVFGFHSALDADGRELSGVLGDTDIEIVPCKMHEPPPPQKRCGNGRALPIGGEFTPIYPHSMVYDCKDAGEGWPGICQSKLIGDSRYRLHLSHTRTHPPSHSFWGSELLLTQQETFKPATGYELLGWLMPRGDRVPYVNNSRPVGECLGVVWINNRVSVDVDCDLIGTTYLIRPALGSTEASKAGYELRTIRPSVQRSHSKVPSTFWMRRYAEVEAVRGGVEEDD